MWLQTIYIVGQKKPRTTVTRDDANAKAQMKAIRDGSYRYWTVVLDSPDALVAFTKEFYEVWAYKRL